MALNNYKNNPEYPDRYTRNSLWKKVLPIQGRPLQAAELTEIQSIVQDNLKQGFDTLFKNGSVIEGLRISVANRTLDSVSLSISKGQIYIEGTILNVNESLLTVPINNIYNIVVIITESIITEEEDATLRDPIKSGFILGTPGAARLVWNTSLAFILSDEVLDNSYAIGQIINGVVLQKELNAFYEIEKLMSQFIYDKNGNFCVEGLNTSSLGLDKRSASNVTKYNSLKSAVDNAEENKQTALSNLVNYQGLVNDLNVQVQNAQIQSSINPSAQNNAVLASLQIQLSKAQSEFSKYSNELAINQKALDIANNSLNNSEALLTDQQVLNISPGVAYIEGYRVSINSPTKLYIPQSLPTTQVEAASFTFRGILAQTLRTFSLSSGTTTEQSNLQYTSLEININNLELNPNIYPLLPSNNFNIKIFYKINSPTNLTNVIQTVFNDITNPTLVNNNITYAIYNNIVGEPLITTDANNVLLTNEVLKSILNEYIKISSPTNNSLLFTASNLTLESSLVNIQIFSKLYLKTTDQLISNLTNLNVDISNQTLSAPISNSTYQLGFRPVQKINRLVANLTATVTITRNDINDSVDLLNEDSVISIIEVSQTVGNIKNVFSSANYYATQSGIGWRPNVTNIPAAGTAYQVEFVYTEPLIEGTDFILNTLTDSIEFIGRTPALNNTFSVDYSYSLSKAGVITIDKDGIINYLLSAPAKNPLTPSIPNTKLGIASFILNSNSIEITQLDCKRQTVADLYNLAEDIKQNTYNNQIIKADLNTLNNALAIGDQPIGVYTDSLINLDKIDLKQSTASIVPGVQGFMNGYVRKESEVIFITANNTTRIINNELGTPQYAILPYTEVKFFSQPRSTKIREIKPISPTINKRARLYSDYKYIFLNDATTELYEGTTIPKSNTKLSPCDPITRSGSFFTAINNNSEIIKNIITNIRNILGPYGSAIIQSFVSKIPLTINNSENLNNFVAKAFNNYKVRPIQIELRGEGLPPLTKGFRLYINGIKWYDYVLRGGTVSSGAGTIAEAQDGFTVEINGTVNLAVTLPKELPTGTHTIEIKKEGAGYCKTNIYVYNTLINQLVLTPLRSWNSLSITTNTDEQAPLIPIDSFSEDLNLLGIDPSINIGVVDNTISYINNIEKAYPDKHSSLTQTFVANEDYFITKVSLKINQASINNNELDVYLLDTNEQIPIKQVKAKTLNPATYNITNLNLNSSGLYTNFNFNRPTLIKKNKKYGIGIENSINNDSNFAVYTAIVDDLDIVTNTIVGEQLFIDGHLFTSIDGSSLSIESKEDLTFELYRANFAESAEINLGVFTIVGGINFFCYNTLDVVPGGTEIIYAYKILNSNNWVNFKPNTTICLSVDAASIEIKATLFSNYKNLTPQLLLKGASCTMFNTSATSIVISNKVEYPKYKKVTIIIDYIKPSNTDIEVFYSPNDGYAYQAPEWIPVPLKANSTIIVEPALQIYRSTYYLEEPSYIYVLQEERTKFRYKIGLTATSTGISPLVKNIQTYVQ